MTTSSAVVYLRARASSLDPITPLVGLVALVVYSLHGFGGVLNRDLGVYAYAGQQFADGVPPYEGILNRAGPLAHMLPGVGMVAGRLVVPSHQIGSTRLIGGWPPSALWRR